MSSYYTKQITDTETNYTTQLYNTWLYTKTQPYHHIMISFQSNSLCFYFKFKVIFLLKYITIGLKTISLFIKNIIGFHFSFHLVFKYRTSRVSIFNAVCVRIGEIRAMCHGWACPV